MKLQVLLSYGHVKVKLHTFLPSHHMKLSGQLQTLAVFFFSGKTNAALSDEGGGDGFVRHHSHFNRHE